jgi:hypothetical protein
MGAAIRVTTSVAMRETAAATTKPVIPYRLQAQWTVVFAPVITDSITAPTPAAGRPIASTKLGASMIREETAPDAATVFFKMNSARSATTGTTTAGRAISAGTRRRGP